MCVIVCFPPTDRECFVRQMKITCCQKAWEIEKNLLPEFRTSCILLLSASHTWMDVIYSILMILCVFCFPAGSWERRSSLRSWSWSNSKGSTGCVKELVLGKSVAAEDKVRHTVFTYMTHPHAFKLTVHPQLRANQVLGSQSQFFSFHCVFPLYPSSVRPAHRCIPFAVWKPYRRYEIFEVVDCCEAALMMVHANILGSVCLQGRDIVQHDASDTKTCALQIWRVKKFKYTKGTVTAN